ncbi:EF-hand domain-containing protein [Sphingomonas sp. RP10(2022)]|uniref:EF-hand domain-containing protein n=1 Tax=Sphingomonas liriopis TaxID=2949094 RepID=A0A9X2HUM9_9SPHN|nr:EF-hand domain-containing protein [Sphingomonas liriopis]MCP3735824.1 EF-hand domain-containing protein [Sphingomonas liriopis]
MLLPLLLQTAAPLPAGAVPAAPGQPPATLVVAPVAMAIAAFDANGDGRTTRAELEAGVARSFAAIDTGGSGSLGYIAFADWAERWLGDRNALPSPFEVDTDGDNRITLAELQAAFARVFARLDVDKDGSVTRKEVLTIRAMAPREPIDRGKKKR